MHTTAGTGVDVCLLRNSENEETLFCKLDLKWPFSASYDLKNCGQNISEFNCASSSQLSVRLEGSFVLSLTFLTTTL